MARKAASKLDFLSHSANLNRKNLALNEQMIELNQRLNEINQEIMQINQEMLEFNEEFEFQFGIHVWSSSTYANGC